jgi:hypothetical protein
MTHHTDTIPQLFDKNRYHVVRSLLSTTERVGLYRFALDAARSGRLGADKLVPNSPASYASEPTDELLERLLPRMEAVAGTALYPTYSYYRVYKNGDVLTPHRDRPSCEISVSIALGFDAPHPWPFFVEGPNGVCRADLYPGDGMLYRGCECRHWREAFVGQHAAQVFLHYVAQNGPNASYRFDGRSSLSHRKPSADAEPAAAAVAGASV